MRKVLVRLVLAAGLLGPAAAFGQARPADARLPARARGLGRDEGAAGQARCLQARPRPEGRGALRARPRRCRPAAAAPGGRPDLAEPARGRRRASAAARRRPRPPRAARRATEGGGGPSRAPTSSASAPSGKRPSPRLDETQRLARALLVQAEQIGTQISDRRRSAFARALLQRIVRHPQPRPLVGGLPLAAARPGGPRALARQLVRAHPAERDARRPAHRRARHRRSRSRSTPAGATSRRASSTRDPAVRADPH